MGGEGLGPEIGKRRPFERPEEEAALNVWRTNEVLQGAFEQLFKTAGISGPLYNVLRILRGEGTPLPCLEISGRMITRVPDITRLVDRLEAKGLVSRSRTEEDRRVVLVSLTRAGLDLLARLDEPVASLHARLLGHLSPAELTELSRLLVQARRPATS